MEKKQNSAWEYVKSIIFVLFLAELFLFFIAIIFGPALGHRFTLTACFGLGILLAAIFASIFLANLTVVFLCDKHSRIKKKNAVRQTSVDT